MYTMFIGIPVFPYFIGCDEIYKREEESSPKLSLLLGINWAYKQIQVSQKPYIIFKKWIPEIFISKLTQNYNLDTDVKCCQL